MTIFYATILLLTAGLFGWVLRWAWLRYSRNGVIGSELVTSRRKNRNNLYFL